MTCDFTDCDSAAGVKLLGGRVLLCERHWLENWKKYGGSGLSTEPIDLEGEEWRAIEGYEDYDVSNMGRVRSWRRRGGNRAKAARLLKQIDRTGYRVLFLTNDWGKQQSFLVHRLVCLAFLENPEDKPYVNHRDFDRANNRLGNLEWVTPAENVEHSRLAGHCNGGHAASEKDGGKRHPRAKLTLAQAIEIKELIRGGMTQNDLARKFKVGRSCIASISCGKTWVHA